MHIGVDVEDSYRENRRKKGITNDREELTFFERKFVYGCSAITINDHEFKLSMNADSSQSIPRED